MKFSQFKTKLSSAVKREATLRDDIDSLARVAIAQYGEHGDTSWIQLLANESKDMRSIATGMLKNYIKSKANVKFADDGEGNFKVTKTGKGAIEVQPIADDERWYDFETSHTIAPDMDLVSVIRAKMSQYEKRLEEGTAKRSTDNDRLLALLNAEYAATAA
jgi:hypothetical protein